ncbi:hypothetical protein Pcinc_023114 [Petrolisthes cinctipes]|uniref:DUF4789 domain-containing protein n=1 Tax=Petrolisthes cinctipes TaxID=88211 RepID=A0AAE1FCF3_PETCI|nr:hypothetical protein Pcinc_023114 [Petrolisthes cinctipes]
MEERRNGRKEEWKKGGMEERRNGRKEEWKKAGMERKKAGMEGKERPATTTTKEVTQTNNKQPLHFVIVLNLKKYKSGGLPGLRTLHNHHSRKDERLTASLQHTDRYTHSSPGSRVKDKGRGGSNTSKMGKVAFTLLVLGGLANLLDCEVTKSETSKLIKRQSPVPLMNPPIPTSIGHYLGGDQQLDKCQRDEILVLGGCHRVLTQGPCKLEEQVLLDPGTKEGFCAARLCSPDRIFVFSDQQCHDPMNTALCPPGRQLYQSAYGTPICQCPDGTYEGDDDLDDDVCDPLLGRTLSCPPNQVLWFRDFRMPPECLPDPCGGENLNRGPNDLPFVPSSTDGRCYQLGQSKGVCPAQTWYSLALDALKGMCTTLEEAGYQIFDEETLAAFNKLYGPPIARESTTPLPTPPSQTTPSLSPQSPQRPVSQQSPQSQIPSQSPVSSLSPQSPSLQPQGQTISGSTQGRQDIPSSQGFIGQPGSATPDQRYPGQPGTFTPGQSFAGRPGGSTGGQGFAGRPGSSTGGQGFAGRPGSSTSGQGFAGRPGSSTGGQGFAGRPGSSTAGQGFAGRPGSSTVGQSFAGQPGTSTAGQNFGGTFSHGQVGVSSSGQSFSGQTGASPGKPTLSPTRQSFSGQTTISSNNQVGGFTTTQKFSGQSGVSSSGHTGMFATSSGFTRQRGASTAGQRFSGQQGFSSGGQVFSGHQSISTTGQISGHTDMSSNGRRFSSQVTVGQQVGSQNTTFRTRMPQASSFLSPPLPQRPTMHGRPNMGQPSGGFAHQGFNQGGYFFSEERMSFERFGAPHMQMRHHNMARGRSFTASAPSQTNVGTPSHHTATKSKPEADLEVREGHLLTAVTGLSDVGKAGTQDLSYLHKPRDHQLHSFYNGVRTIVSGVLNGSGHHRGRRSPLPHATPGNVFETRLVGCRAGAVRDINAKCRSTILPARAPVKRSTRVVPPVPPRPGCPTGQVYNLRRMCSARDDANNSVNSFNLGK